MVPDGSATGFDGWRVTLTHEGKWFVFFSLQALGARGLHRPLYRPPRRRVHIWRQSGLVPRTSDKVYGGHRVFTANHGGNRAALGQPPRHFARILHEGGGLHVEMAAVSNLGCSKNTYFFKPAAALRTRLQTGENMEKWQKNGREKQKKPPSQTASASRRGPRRVSFAPMRRRTIIQNRLIGVILFEL